MLSRETITAAAIRIADEEGLQAVSIRRVAAELDARPMSLYDHIADKWELLSLMADEVVVEALVPGPMPKEWREAVSTIARRIYAMLVGHGWLIGVYTHQPRFGPNVRIQAKQMAEAAAGMGKLPEGEIWMLLGTVNDYVLGHSVRVVNLAPSSRIEDVIPESDLVEVPELASLPDSLRTRASVERFEAGLAVVLDGVKRRIEAVGDE